MMGASETRFSRKNLVSLHRGKLLRHIKLAIIVCCLVVACQGNDPAPTTAPKTTGRADALPHNTPLSTFVPSATPYASAMPLPSPRSPLVEAYVVQAGDTLGGISLAYGVSLPELLAFNGLESEAAIIQIGQTLHIPLDISRTGPQEALLPDSEVVYSPAYVGFDVADFLARQGGYLAAYAERVNGEAVNGAQIITNVARQYSVGPRVLLTLLEHYAGWVTNPQPALAPVLGPANPYGEETLTLQLSWTANRVNEGYYGYKRDGQVAVRFYDGGRAIIPGGLNAGSAGIQNILAVNGSWETWSTQMEAFVATYQRLFGDPFTPYGESNLAVEPLVPIDLKQPPLRLPWEPGQTFYYTGGPHAAYGSRSAWAAVDFAPPDVLGSCYYSQENVVAASDGRLFLAGKGETYLDLDGDGNLQTGWVLLYLHVVARDDLLHGQRVTAGTPLGYASCEGGYSNSSHLHLARRYNGEWMAADGPVPLVLSGWEAKAGLAQYDGTLVRDGVTKTACECRDEALNGIAGE
jgi:LasA protease